MLLPDIHELTKSGVLGQQLVASLHELINRPTASGFYSPVHQHPLITLDLLQGTL